MTSCTLPNGVWPNNSSPATTHQTVRQLGVSRKDGHICLADWIVKKKEEEEEEQKKKKEEEEEQKKKKKKKKDEEEKKK